MALLRKSEVKKIKRYPRPRPQEDNTTIIEDEFTEILKLIDHHRRVRDQADDLIKALNADLLGSMTTQSVSRKLPDGTVLKATKAKGRTTTTLNEGKLKYRLGARLWGRVTSRALDKGKLDLAIKSGEVDPTLVAACIEEETGDPYIIFSKK